MGKSTWVIEISVDEVCWDQWDWRIHNRKNPSIRFEAPVFYTRKSSAIRGAKRIAKALRINAEVEE